MGLIAGPILAGCAFAVLPELRLDDAGNAIGGLSDAGRAAAAVAALMATWWLTEALPLPATALVPIALFPLFDVLPIAEVGARYGHQFIGLFLGGFILGLAMQRWGLHRRIALVTILLVGTKPRMLIAGFMLATALLSMFISNTATAVMLMPIAASVILLVEQELEKLPGNADGSDDTDPGFDPDRQADRFATALLLGIAYAASIGGMGTLIGTPPNAVLAGYIEDEFGRSISFLDWMRVGLPLVVVFLPIAWWVLVGWVYKIKLRELPGGRALIKKELRDLGRMSRGEWIVLVVFTLTASAWLARGGLNTLGDRLDVAALANLSDTGIALIAAVALFAIPVRPREGVYAMDWETAQRLPWGVLLLFGGGLALAAGLSATGVDRYLGSGFEVLGGLPIWLLIAIVCVLVKLLTELTSNTAVTTALLPVLAAAAFTLGVDAAPLLIATALSASCAFMLPVATPPNAVVFSSPHLTIGKMVRAGVVLNVIGVVLVTLLLGLGGGAILPSVFLGLESVAPH